MTLYQRLSKQIRFDRNEFSGAFGDIGTDLPLIIGMIIASGLDSASVLIIYGAMQVITALINGGGLAIGFEELALMVFIKDIIDSKKSFFIALLMALICCGLPYGYLVGMIVGTVLFYISDKNIRNYLKIP